MKSTPLNLSAVLMCLGCCVMLGLAPHPARAQGTADFVTADQLTDQEVQWAIDALVEGLYQRRNNSGTWERQYANSTLAHLNAHASGQTTLAMLALLMAGETYQDPRLQAALDYMLSTKSDHTYVRSLRAHVWALLPDRFKKTLDADRVWLLNAYGYESGSWGYGPTPIESGYDNSLTQYGVLGLWEAAKRGQDIPLKFWQRVEEHYLRTQLQNGGWSYRPQFSGGRGSMTAAGLTCLFVTQDYLHAAKFQRPGMPQTVQQKAIQRGMDWLDANFTAEFHPGAPGNRNEYYYFYYLYGIERVGLAGGYKRFGRHDWFRVGAAAIINRLCEPLRDGDCIYGYKARNSVEMTGIWEPPDVQMAFGLMFLTRGRVPIMISKIRDNGIAWNNRPRDAANLTRWISEETEQNLSWQILDMDRSLEEWFDGPLVYLASHKPVTYVSEHREYYETLKRRQEAWDRRNQDITNPAVPRPTRDQITTVDRIKHYLDLGGLLLTNADGQSPQFTDSIATLAHEMYPQYEWGELPEDHWVYQLSAPVEKRPVLYGLSNGVRDVIIHSPKGDLGVILQMDHHITHPDSFATLSNLYYYTSERGMTRRRLERKLVLDDPDSTIPAATHLQIDDPATTIADASEPIVVLRGEYDGYWNAEPAAAEVLRVRLEKTRGMNVRFQTVRLDALPNLKPMALGTLLWICGTADHTFRPAELDGIHSFVEAGGTILFENVGGNRSRFGLSSERQVAQLYPEETFRRQSRTPVITGEGLPTGQDCARVTYRLHSLDRFGSRETRPRLRALVTPSEDANDETNTPREAIFVSREDLSHAALGQPCWGISGYVTDDAVKLLGNLIEYAQQRR